MVDSIRQTNRIGVVKAAGQVRSVEQRRQFPEKQHHQDGEDSPTAREESRPTPTEDQASAETDAVSKPSSGNEDNPVTGRCIDVRI